MKNKKLLVFFTTVILTLTILGGMSVNAVVEAPPCLPGDVDGDGDVTAADARIALRASSKLITLTAEQITAADVDGCGEVTAADARQILRFSSRLIISFVGYKNKLVVGFDSRFPPMSYVDENGFYTGFDIDMARAIADKLNIELVLKPMDWEYKDIKLDSGSIDCIISGFTMTDKRLEEYTWTTPYIQNKQVLVVLGDSDYRTIYDLYGAAIGVVYDTYTIYSDILFKNSLKDIKYNWNTVNLIQDLNAGLVEGIIFDSVLANYLIKNNNENIRIIHEFEATTEKYGIGFLLGNTELRDTVQKALNELYADGTLSKISENWFGIDVIRFS